MVNRSKVLIVDGSALMRQLLTQILGSDSELEVVGTAGDPFIAEKRSRH
jgi:two-component system chemotaxis response regulator CheB